MTFNERLESGFAFHLSGDAQKAYCAIVIRTFFTRFNLERISCRRKSTIDIGLTLALFITGCGKETKQ